MTLRHSRFKIVDGEVITPGHDWSIPLLLLYGNGRFQVWWKRSVTAWMGIALRGTYEAEYMIVRTTEKPDRDGYHYATTVIEINPGYYWSRARKALIAACDALAAIDDIVSNINQDA